MKNTGIATLLALLIPTLARAASPESFTINVNDRLAPEITVEQAEPAVFTVTFMDGASPYDLNGKVPFMFWSKSATIPPTVRASFSVVSITGGVVQFSFTAADLNLTNGTQTAIYGIGVQNYPQTVARGRFRITPNPYSSGAGDIPWATNVMWGTIPWVGMPIFLTNLHSAGQSGSGGVVVDAGGDATITFPAEVDPIFTNSDVFGITHADRVAWSNSVIRSQTNESDIAALRQDLANETAARTNADASIRHDLGTDVSSLGLSLSNAVAGVLGDVSALSSDTVHRVSGSGRISASGTTNVALTFDASGLATTGEVASVAQAAGQAYSVATNALDIAQQAAAASIDQTARDGVVAVGLVATNALNIALAASNRADSAFSVATNATLLASNAFAQGSSAYTIATNALQKAGDASNVAASAYLTATNAAALATQAQAHADSAYLYATNAEAVALAAYPASNPSNFITSSEVTGLGTDTTARAWAQAASNLAAAAYPASNPSNYITAADVPQVATDATARATAIAASNLAAAAYSLASTNVPAGVVTTSDVGSVTAAMLAEQYVKDGDNLGSGFTGGDTAGLTAWTSVSGGGGGIDFNTWSANTNAVLTGLNADMLDGKHATAFVGTGAYATAIGGITGDVAQLRANMTAATGTLANAFLRGTNNGAQTLQVIIDQGGGNTIHTNAVGARQMGFMLASNSIASGSHGAVQRGAFTSTNRIGTNAVGATQAGKFMNNNSIGNGAFGAMQIGFLFENNEIVGPAYGAAQIGYTASGTAATNNAAAGLQLLSLEAGQTAFMSSAAKGAFGIGAVSVTSKNAIVTGDGNTSHGEGTITTRGYYEQTTNGTYRIDGATHARLATNAVQKTDSAYTNAKAKATSAVQPTDSTYTQAVARAATAYGWGDHAAAGYATTGGVASTYATKTEAATLAANWSTNPAVSDASMGGHRIGGVTGVTFTLTQEPTGPAYTFAVYNPAASVGLPVYIDEYGNNKLIYGAWNFSPSSYLTVTAAQTNYFRKTASVPSSSSDPGLPHQVAIKAINATSAWVYMYFAESNKWMRAQFNDF